jgi:hypothetical protein
MERLAETLKLFRLIEQERARQLAKWRVQLDEDDDAIDMIFRWLVRENRKREAVPRSRADHELIQSHLTYIRNNKEHMRYASARKRGIPTGSGATEG